MTILVAALAVLAALLAVLLTRARARARALRQQLALHEAGHQGLRVGLKVWRLDNPTDPGSLRLLASNPAAAEATGVPLRDVMGKRIDEAFPESVNTGIAQAFADVVVTGESRYMGEVVYADARSTEGIYEVYCYPLPDRCVGVAFENITRRRTVELQIERSSTLIRMLAEVAVAANAGPDAHTALRESLTAVCRRTGWSLGHLYWPDASDDVLVSSGIWYLPDPEPYADLYRATTEGRFRPGEGLPGRVFRNIEPDWTIDATLDGDSARTAAVRAAGLRATLVFPVFVEDEPVAVMEFFASRAPIPDEELLNVMHQVGEALGHALRRTRGAAGAAAP